MSAESVLSEGSEEGSVPSLSSWFTFPLRLFTLSLFYAFLGPNFSFL